MASEEQQFDEGTWLGLGVPASMDDQLVEPEAEAETSVDQELRALAALVDTLEPLDLKARRRVLDWACERFYSSGLPS